MRVAQGQVRPDGPADRAARVTEPLDAEPVEGGDQPVRELGDGGRRVGGGAAVARQVVAEDPPVLGQLGYLAIPHVPGRPEGGPDHQDRGVLRPVEPVLEGTRGLGGRLRGGGLRRRGLGLRALRRARAGRGLWGERLGLRGGRVVRRRGCGAGAACCTGVAGGTTGRGNPGPAGGGAWGPGTGAAESGGPGCGSPECGGPGCGAGPPRWGACGGCGVVSLTSLTRSRLVSAPPGPGQGVAAETT